MARPIKGAEKQNEVISWKCTREIKDTVTALASYRNQNIPDLLTALVLEAAEKDRAGVESMKKLESEIAAVQARIEQARAAVRENPATAIKLNTLVSTTSAEAVHVEDTDDTADDSGGNDDTSDSGNSAAGKKKA